MQTIYKISQLDTTIILTDKEPKHNNDCQKSVKLTSKTKLSIIDKVDKVSNELLRVASIERKKESKRNFFNKHKNK